VIAVQDVIRAAGFTHIAYRPVNGSNK
jgi:hypothetical protein